MKNTHSDMFFYGENVCVNVAGKGSALGVELRAEYDEQQLCSGGKQRSTQTSIIGSKATRTIHTFSSTGG